MIKLSRVGKYHGYNFPAIHEEGNVVTLSGMFEEDVEIIYLRFQAKVEAYAIVIKPRDVELDDSIITDIIVSALKDYELCFYTNGSIVKPLPCQLIDKKAFVTKEIEDSIVVLDIDEVEWRAGKEAAEAVRMAKDAEVRIVDIKPAKS